MTYNLSNGIVAPSILIHWVALSFAESRRKSQLLKTGFRPSSD